MPAEEVNEEAEQPMYFQVIQCMTCLSLMKRCDRWTLRAGWCPA